MNGDLKPTIIESRDDTILDRQTGRVRHVVRTWFTYGELGPFKVDVDADQMSSYALDAAIEAKIEPFKKHL